VRPRPKPEAGYERAVLGQPHGIQPLYRVARLSEGLDRMMAFKIQAKNAFSPYAACAFSSTFCI